MPANSEWSALAGFTAPKESSSKMGFWVQSESASCYRDRDSDRDRDVSENKSRDTVRWVLRR
jgi:hypothetical protein